MQDIFADSFLFLCLGFSVLQVQTALVNPFARPVTDPAWTQLSTFELRGRVLLGARCPSCPFFSLPLLPFSPWTGTASPPPPVNPLGVTCMCGVEALRALSKQPSLDQWIKFCLEGNPTAWVLQDSALVLAHGSVVASSHNKNVVSVP